MSHLREKGEQEDGENEKEKEEGEKEKDEALTHSSMEEEESGVEEDHDESMDEEGLGGERGRHPAITGRGITISMLMQEGLIEPADNSMSIEYLGRKFTGDLLSDGRIYCHQSKESFNSPSAWAINCKKAVNPAKKSGCGWASVKYKNKKLDAFKSTWFQRQQPKTQSPFGESSSGDPEEKKPDVGEEEESKVKSEDSENDGPLNLTMTKPVVADTGPTVPTTRLPSRPCIKHATLGRRSNDHDANTLVECTSFETLGKIQPFTVSLTSNTLLLMDFHCHLTTSEVVGYLGGKWDPSSQHLSVLQAFPCRCRLADRDRALVVEEEIRQNMERRGLSLVGWYHSHPYAAPAPSLKDIDAQMDYQLRLKGVGHTYQPCIGLICSPYNPDARQKESKIAAYWVMPPPETRVHEYGMPMTMHYDAVQDVFLSQDVLNEMQWVMDFFGKAPDKINFKDTWQHSLTFLDKIKGTLSRKFPKDQTDGRFQDFITNLLIS